MRPTINLCWDIIKNNIFYQEKRIALPLVPIGRGGFQNWPLRSPDLSPHWE